MLDLSFPISLSACFVEFLGLVACFFECFLDGTNDGTGNMRGRLL